MRIPITFGIPWFYKRLKNSNDSISKPIEASIKMSAKSQILAKSIIAYISVGHSYKVILLFLFVLRVIVPRTSWIFYFVKCYTRDLIKVVLPLSREPYTTITKGGSRFSVRSCSVSRRNCGYSSELGY